MLHTLSFVGVCFFFDETDILSSVVFKCGSNPPLSCKDGKKFNILKHLLIGQLQFYISYEIFLLQTVYLPHLLDFSG